MASSKKGLAVGAAAVAAGVGYLVGILTAPKSGKETRQELQRSALAAKVEAEKKLKLVNTEINSVIDEATGKAKSAKEAAKKELDTRIAEAKEAKEKVRQVLSAVHEGSAEDADLDKAIKHAKRAIHNLKDYLSGDAKASK